jgi:hypothetical protein
MNNTVPNNVFYENNVRTYVRTYERLSNWRNGDLTIRWWNISYFSSDRSLPSYLGRNLWPLCPISDSRARLWGAGRDLSRRPGVRRRPRAARPDEVPRGLRQGSPQVNVEAGFSTGVRPWGVNLDPWGYIMLHIGWNWGVGTCYECTFTDTINSLALKKKKKFLHIRDCFCAQKQGFKDLGIG